MADATELGAPLIEESALMSATGETLELDAKLVLFKGRFDPVSGAVWKLELGRSVRVLGCDDGPNV